MKARLLRLAPTGIFVSTLFVVSYAMAEESVVAPQDFLAQVLDFIKGFGGLPMVLKIAGVITILISSMKVSFLNPLWNKLGGAKSWLAPALGAVAGILAIAKDGNHITLAAITAWAASGGGAVILHELLDSIKAIPNLGKTYVAIIEFIQQVTGGPKTPPDTKK